MCPFFSYLGACNIDMYYDLKGLPEFTSGPARRDNEAVFVESRDPLQVRRSFDCIDNRDSGIREYLRWNESPGGILSGRRRRLVVIIHRRS